MVDLKLSYKSVAIEWSYIVTGIDLLYMFVAIDLLYMFLVIQISSMIWFTVSLMLKPLSEFCSRLKKCWPSRLYFCCKAKASCALASVYSMTRQYMTVTLQFRGPNCYKLIPPIFSITLLLFKHAWPYFYTGILLMSRYSDSLMRPNHEARTLS